jgi:Mg2+ and Co2+ transporter CorA
MAEAGLTPPRRGPPGAGRHDDALPDPAAPASRASDAARSPGLPAVPAAAVDPDGSELDPGAAPDGTAPASASVSTMWIEPGRCETIFEVPDPLPARGYAWVDAHSEAPREWVATVERLTGVTILEEHLSDAENPAHPSYFDSTRDYEMIVFRGLAVRPEPALDDVIRIRTRPTVFFLFARCIVCVHAADSRQIPALRLRLLEAGRFRHRLPARPEELMLRILNGMVDRYLELRQPLTEQLETWQRELLDPRRPFHDWVSLLESRRQLRKLENLSEEQLDALQEWRDERLDRRGGDEERRADWADAIDDRARSHPQEPSAPPLPALSDAHEVRVNDLVEHIERVRGHARRLESTVESAVQLHFSATAHRTNQIMQTLTVITAIFMPLTLITGIFGMNFEVMPGIHSPAGFWWTIGAMGAIALGLVAIFRTRRYLAETGPRGAAGRRRRRSVQAARDPAATPGADTNA